MWSLFVAVGIVKYTRCRSNSSSTTWYTCREKERTFYYATNLFSWIVFFAAFVLYRLSHVGKELVENETDPIIWPWLLLTFTSLCDPCLLGGGLSKDQSSYHYAIVTFLLVQLPAPPSFNERRQIYKRLASWMTPRSSLDEIRIRKLERYVN